MSIKECKVTVVIPCYNTEKYIRNAIESVLSQSYSSIEIVVIDDGSTDKSAEITRSYEKKVKLVRQKNKGAPAARNHGIKVAKGEYIKFLDADDVLVDGCIERQVEQSESLSSDRKAVVFGDAVWVDEGGNHLDGYNDFRSKKPNESTVAHLLHSNPLTPCPLHRREYLMEVGGFDPSIPTYGEEHDLHIRLALAGVEFIYRPIPVCYYRQHGNTDRLSETSYTRRGLMTHFNLVQRYRRSIEESQIASLSSDVRRALASSLWRHGRAILREGHEEVAERYFDGARELSGGRDYVVGSMPYKVIHGLGGPYVAERVLSAVKATMGIS
ncbi:glycosyltransferase [Salinibacter ruber]|uniref:glycosyltransferase n=1 Tax=Salinibacter ruber TaxID=146919 RepID=UPI00216791F7|nr:glycosyltransferase [Salinibacter ruber]MCS3824355.1 glycosyltransferase involved in cell wall biosynthesis [Salinibacter ruber]